MTYARTIIAAFADLGAGLNAALTAAGLPTLRDWFKGEPRKLRATNTPYAWFDILDGSDIETEWPDEAGELSLEHYTLPVGVGLVVGGATPEELLDLLCDVPPTVIASIEAQLGGCVTSAGWGASDRAVESNSLLRAVLLPFLVAGDRLRGGVA